LTSRVSFERLKLRNWWARIRMRYALIALLGAYTCIVSYVQILRYETFTDAWDFSGYSQAIWSATQRTLFRYTTEPFFSKGFPVTLGQSFLATHFSPIMAILVPAVAIVPSPTTLLVIQTCWCAVSAFFIYKISRLYLDYHTSLAIVGIYLINPTMLDAQFSGLFHVETFTFLSGTVAMYGLLSKRYWVMWLGVALTLATIEVAPFIVFPILFLYWFRDKPRWRSAIFSSVLILGYLFLADSARNLLGLDSSTGSITYAINSSNWSILGANVPISIPGAILSHPGNLIPALSFDSTAKLSWLVSLLGPLVFSPLVDALMLLPSLPWILASLLSNYSSYYSSVATQTAAFTFPFIFVAAVTGLAKLNSRKVIALALLASLLFLGAYGPFQSSINSNIQVTQHDTTEADVLGMIPGSASILTTSQISPHLAMRSEIYQIPPDIRPIFLNVSDEILQRAHQVAVDYVVFDTFPTSQTYVLTETQRLVTGFDFTGYGLYIFDDGVVVYRLGWAQPPVVESPATYPLSAFDLLQGAYLNGSAIEVTSGVGGWFGPYTILPPGNYTATFDLVVRSGTIDLDIASGLGANVIASVTALHTGLYQLNFSLPRATDNIEFRGLNPSNDASLELRGVIVSTR